MLKTTKKARPHINVLDLVREITDRDCSSIVAAKIIAWFEIGQLIKIDWLHPSKYRRGDKMPSIPKDMMIPIIGTEAGFIICFPVGHLVWDIIRDSCPEEKSFSCSLENEIYSIWRIR